MRVFEIALILEIQYFTADQTRFSAGQHPLNLRKTSSLGQLAQIAFR